MKKTVLIFLFLMMGRDCFSQSLDVVSHYPASAYVVDRLLPFVVTGDIGLRVVRVEVIPSGYCPTMVDPYFSNMFHVFCKQPGRIDLDIIVVDQEGLESRLDLRDLSIAVQRPPRDEFDSAFREAQDRGEP